MGVKYDILTLKLCKGVHLMIFHRMSLAQRKSERQNFLSLAIDRITKAINDETDRLRKIKKEETFRFVDELNERLQDKQKELDSLRTFWR